MVEKLLRSCRDVKMIYLLVREKRGKNVNERLTDLTQSQVSILNLFYISVVVVVVS